MYQLRAVGVSWPYTGAAVAPAAEGPLVLINRFPGQRVESGFEWMEGEDEASATGEQC